jgi:tetratricopeptide (TPR) repeat protein
MPVQPIIGIGHPATPGKTLAPVRGRRLFAWALVGSIAVFLLAAIATGGLVRSKAKQASQKEKIDSAKRYLDEGHPTLALRTVRPIVDSDSEAGEALAVAGIALAALDQRAASRVVLERALKRQSNQPMAQKVLAAIYLSCGDYERGLTHLRAAADLEPRDARPWIGIGKAYHDLGRFHESADSYQAALHRDPGLREARIGFISMALKSRRPDRAAPQLLEALEEAPDDPQFLGLAGRHAHALGHPEQAASFAGRALALEPDNFDALIARATSYLLNGESKNALVDLERAVAVNPDSMEALRLLAQAESRLGLTERARKSIEHAQSIEERLLVFDRLTSAIAERPDDAEPRWRMGQVAAQANMLEIAANSYRAALAIDPNCQPARDGLASLNVAHGGPPPSR